ncbi:MAG: gamma-glutamyltransferase [Candidatus Omnitrophica bacterium]|nr:gamma-glutamyltransferase [Candidatus Omnitrophota bacterium]
MMKFRQSLILVLIPLLCLPSSWAEASEKAWKAMAVTADPAATQAAVEILKKGGNAVDAAIAAQWVLNVVEPQSSGIGGGGFFIYYDAASRKVFAFDGRETAPASARPEMFLGKDGKPVRFWPERISGGLPAGVPGLLKLLKTVHARFSSNKVSFASLFEPAIEIAEKGFPISERLGGALQKEESRLKLFKATRKVFFDKAGRRTLRAGEILVQEDLGRTFRLLAGEGIGPFYEGAIAKDIVKAVRKASVNPAKMTIKDLASYEVVEREPVRGTYRGYEVWGMPPPSSGGPTVQMVLNILENFSWDSLSSEHRMSVFAQAQRLAFIERNKALADPAAMTVDLEDFLSKDKAKKLAAVIDPVDASQALGPKDPPAQEGTHTSHLSIADADGNLVAFTTTIEHLFGCGMIVPGRGFFLNNELTDFDAQIYGEADGQVLPNAPGPRKRPRSSMSPTLVFKNSEPYLITGSPGGSKIIGAVLNVLVNVLDEKLPLQEAVDRPRVLNREGAVELEGFSLDENPGEQKRWESLGFEVVRHEAFGNTQSILFHEDGFLEGASDPRGIGAPGGVE